MKNLSIALVLLALSGSTFAEEKPAPKKVDAAISLKPVEKKPELIDASDLLKNPKFNPDLSGLKLKPGCQDKSGVVTSEGEAGYKQCVIDRDTKPSASRPAGEAATVQFGK